MLLHLWASRPSRRVRAAGANPYGGAVTAAPIAMSRACCDRRSAERGDGLQARTVFDAGAFPRPIISINLRRDAAKIS